MKAFGIKFLLAVSSLGYFGVALALMVEVIPSEIVLGYAGYMVHKGNLGFWGAVAAGTVGGTLAQLFLYWAALYGGRPVLEKWGKFVFISKKHIDSSEKWFSRYGAAAIFFARFIPVARHAISIPAGLSKMGFRSFTLITLAAVFVWSVAFIRLGQALGENWMSVSEAAAPYTKPAVAVAVLFALGWGLWIFFKSKRKQSS